MSGGLRDSVHQFMLWDLASTCLQLLQRICLCTVSLSIRNFSRLVGPDRPSSMCVNYITKAIWARCGLPQTRKFATASASFSAFQQLAYNSHVVVVRQKQRRNAWSFLESKVHQGLLMFFALFWLPVVGFPASALLTKVHRSWTNPRHQWKAVLMLVLRL